MNELWSPASIFLAAVGSTYFFCVRPMRRANRAPSAAGHSRTGELDRALDEARTELTKLRGGAELNLPAHHGTPAPTRDRLLKEEHQ